MGFYQGLKHHRSSTEWNIACVEHLWLFLLTARCRSRIVLIFVKTIYKGCCTTIVSVVLLILGVEKKTWWISNFMIMAIDDRPGFWHSLRSIPHSCGDLPGSKHSLGVCFLGRKPKSNTCTAWVILYGELQWRHHIDEPAVNIPYSIYIHIYMYMYISVVCMSYRKSLWALILHILHHVLILKQLTDTHQEQSTSSMVTARTHIKNDT